MIKKISIIVAALAVAVAFSTAMAKTPKRHSHPQKSPRIFKQVPNLPYERQYQDRLRQYEEDKRKGWYKVDKA